MAPTTASLPTTLRSPPLLASYTPVAEHQSRTPASFYDGPPVLHYHATGARAYVSRANRDKLPWGGSEATAASAAAQAGDGAAWPVMGDGMVEQAVDVFVGSDTLTLYSPAAGCGVALPYPVIGLHAIKSAYTAGEQRVPTIYMQLELAGVGDEDEPETVELTVVPAAACATAAAAADAEAAAVPATAAGAPPPSASEASKMFDAISACADLHPDQLGDGDDDDDGAEDGGYPSFFRQGANGHEDGEDYDEYEDDDEDEDGDGILVEGADGAPLQPIEGFRGVFRGGGGGGGGSSDAPATLSSDLPPAMPGSGGWITAENAHEFFDEDGNWRGRGGRLGEGAGRVRGRDEVEGGTGAGSGAPASAEDAAAAGDRKEEGRAAAGAPDHDAASNGDGTDTKRVRTA